MTLFIDYGDVEDISSRLLLPSLAFSIVTPLFVIARFVSRRFYAKGFGADDWVCLASLVIAEVIAIQMIIITQWAFGKHKADIPQALFAKSMKLYFYAQILYKVNIGTTKISILLLYIQVFISRWFVRTCWSGIAIVIAFTIGTVFGSIFQCTPVQFAFDKTLPGGGTCIDMTVFWFTNAAFNISTDFVIITLPVPIIVRLQLPLRTKLALCGVFAVGIVVCITSILRITTLDIATSHADMSWANIGSSMWTIIEINLGIICACLPPLWRPLSKIIPTLLGRVGKLAPTKKISGSDSNSRSHSSRRSKLRLTSLEGPRPADIVLQPVNITSLQPGEGPDIIGGYESATYECRGSEDRILVTAGSGGHEEEVDKGIRKTTRVVVQYDNQTHYAESTDHDAQHKWLRVER